MFGIRITQVFASRWKALFWSLGVLFTAYCTVPDREVAPADGSQPAAVVPGLADIPQMLPPPEE